MHILKVSDGKFIEKWDHIDFHCETNRFFLWDRYNITVLITVFFYLISLHRKLAYLNKRWHLENNIEFFIPIYNLKILQENRIQLLISLFD